MIIEQGNEVIEKENNVIEQDNELNEEKLNSFITQRECDLIKAKNHVIRRSLKKIGIYRKEARAPLKNPKEWAEERAKALDEMVLFLKRVPYDKLAAMTLLKKKCTDQDQYIQPDSPADKKALFRFATNDIMKSMIKQFREQYPNWASLRKQLRPKIELNNNQVLINLADGSILAEEPKKLKKKELKKKGKRKNISGEEIPNGNSQGELPPKKLKKKGKRKNISGEEIPNGNDQGELPPKKLKKKGKRKNISGEEIPNGNDQGELPPPKKKKKSADLDLSVFTECNGLGYGSKKKGAPPKKKLNAIEKFMTRDLKPDTSLSGKTTEDKAEMAHDVDSKDGDNQRNAAARPIWQSNPNPRGRGGKLQMEKGNRKPYVRNGYNKGMSDSTTANGEHPSPKSKSAAERYKPLPTWKVRQFAVGNNPNTSNVKPDLKSASDAPMAAPQAEGEEKSSSLLRPTWLTNPEESKPLPPMPEMNGQRNAQRREPRNGRKDARNGRNQPRNGKREPRNGRREPRNGRREPRGGRGGRKDASNANYISVPSDWKEKIESKLTVEAEKPSSGSSLLRPTWLTNPDEYKPPPVNLRDDGKGRGGGRGRGRRGGGWGRGKRR